MSLAGCCDIHRLYRNNGSTFVEINREDTGGLDGFFAGSSAFADYDNDGDLDLITSGREDGTFLHLYNISNSNFTSYSQDPESNITDIHYSSLAWLDLDNDSDLDLIETGYDTDVRAFVYISNASLTKNNTKPNPTTTAFSSSYNNGVFNLSWGNGSDTETNTSGLYYNLMVGNATTNNTIVSGVYGGSSNPTAGYFGNMMQRKSISLNTYLASGTYNWYVQTIDTGLAKSNWSAVQSIVVGSDITAPIISSVSSSVTSSTATITWTTDESSNSSVYYGTTTATSLGSGSSSLVTPHSISLSSLSASTLYYYNVSSCDYWENCNTSIQYNFTTSAADSPGGSSGGGSSTPIITTQPKEFDVDFSVEDGGSFEVKQGEIKTFTFNKEVIHKITLTEITGNSAKIIIESEPIILILALGEIKQVDLNQDGINDIEIKLVSIYGGKAKFSLTKLIGAEIVTKEEEALFDVKISISDKFKKVFPGEEVTAQIEVFNVRKLGQVDVKIDYYITSKEDNTTKLAEGSDTLAVEAVTSFIRTLTIPEEVKSGTYLFNVDVSYKNIVEASSNTEFEVKRTEMRFIEKRFKEIIIGAIILIAIGIFIYLWKIRRREEKDIGRLERIVRKLKPKRKNGRSKNR